MTQPPNGPYGSGDNQDDGEPTWGGTAGPEPTWGGTPAAGADWGQGPRYEPTTEYRPGSGPSGYGPPPQGPKRPNKTPWIAGITAAAVLVVVLAVVLFVTLGGDEESNPIVDSGPLTTTSSQSSTAQAEGQIEDTIRTYTIAFSDADWETALSLTCGAEQDIIRDLQSDTGVQLNGMKLNSVTGIEIDGNTAEATVSLTYVNPADQSPVETSRFTFTMENRLDTWKICDTREI